MVVSHNKCLGCGVLRPSAWFSKRSGKTGLFTRCRPCKALYTRTLAERHQSERRSAAPVTNKWCSACKRTLPAESFAISTASKDGYQSRCKECKNSDGAARFEERVKRLNNQTLVVVEGTERVCSQCQVCKPWTEYHKRPTTALGIHSLCKQCHMYRPSTIVALTADRK